MGNFALVFIVYTRTVYLLNLYSFCITDGHSKRMSVGSSRKCERQTWRQFESAIVGIHQLSWKGFSYADNKDENEYGNVVMWKEQSIV